jgi:hypothetical protein
MVLTAIVIGFGLSTFFLFVSPGSPGQKNRWNHRVYGIGNTNHLLLAIPLSADYRLSSVQVPQGHGPGLRGDSFGLSGDICLRGPASRPPAAVNVGGWKAPHGILLAIDPLTLVMLLLTATVFLAATLYQAGRSFQGRKRKDGVYT